MVRRGRVRHCAGMSTVNGYRIAPVEPRTLDDAAALEAAKLQQAMQHERVPEDPLTPLDVIVKRMRADTPGQTREFFGASDANGRFVGYGVVGQSLNEPENAHVRWCEIFVMPAHRRHGIGRTLARALVATAASDGEGIVFMGQTNDRVPSGAEFARAIGAAAGLEMKMNQLTIADVDRAKVAEWAKIDPAGYRLERADNVVPAALAPSYLMAANAMNDMPKGTLAFEDQEFTEQQLRDREAFLKNAGIEWRLLVAIHGETGEGAGFTEVQYDPRVPHVIWQGGTGVVRAHRGHKLGLWMKAVMLKRILADWPAARFIRTGNANTNEWMLAINTQLGFHHAWSNTLWQVGIAQARTSLGVTPAGATAR